MAPPKLPKIYNEPRDIWQSPHEIQTTRDGKSTLERADPYYNQYKKEWEYPPCTWNAVRKSFEWPEESWNLTLRKWQFPAPYSHPSTHGVWKHPVAEFNEVTKRMQWPPYFWNPQAVRFEYAAPYWNANTRSWDHPDPSWNKNTGKWEWPSAELKQYKGIACSEYVSPYSNPSSGNDYPDQHANHNMDPRSLCSPERTSGQGTSVTSSGSVPSVSTYGQDSPANSVSCYSTRPPGYLESTPISRYSTRPPGYLEPTPLTPNVSRPLVEDRKPAKKSKPKSSTQPSKSKTLDTKVYSEKRKIPSYVKKHGEDTRFLAPEAKLPWHKVFIIDFPDIAEKEYQRDGDRDRHPRVRGFLGVSKESVKTPLICYFHPAFWSCIEGNSDYRILKTRLDDHTSQDGIEEVREILARNTIGAIFNFTRSCSENCKRCNTIEVIVGLTSLIVHQLYLKLTEGTHQYWIVEFKLHGNKGRGVVHTGKKFENWRRDMEELFENYRETRVKIDKEPDKKEVDAILKKEMPNEEGLASQNRK